MPTNDRPGETTVRRYLDRQRVLSLAEADFSPIFTAYAEHVRRWELPLDPLSETMMREGLAVLGLRLVSRPWDETIGVTINIQEPPLNLFLTGDAGALTITGRVFTEDVQTAGRSRMFVQTFRPKTGAVQSSLDVSGLDVLHQFEEYYARSEQLPAKFFGVEGQRYGMVQALPDGGRERVEAMSQEGAIALFDGDLDPLDEKTLRFRCGCNPGKIVQALRQIYAGKDEELFQGESRVEVFCPRCGARWSIERAAYEATPPEG